jgi:hypothetical protein
MFKSLVKMCQHVPYVRHRIINHASSVLMDDMGAHLSHSHQSSLRVDDLNVQNPQLKCDYL